MTEPLDALDELRRLWHVFVSDQSLNLQQDVLVQDSFVHTQISYSILDTL